MAKLKVFEIHTLRDGAWKIDSIFDDRERAVMKGERMGRNARYQEVLVVEETFDEETERVGTLTIYRSTKERQQTEAQTDSEEPPSAGVIEAERRQRLASRRTPPLPEVLEELRRRRLASTRSPPKTSIVSQILGKSILFLTITGITLWLIIILNTII